MGDGNCSEDGRSIELGSQAVAVLIPREVIGWGENACREKQPLLGRDSA